MLTFNFSSRDCKHIVHSFGTQKVAMLTDHGTALITFLSYRLAGEIEHHATVIPEQALGGVILPLIVKLPEAVLLVHEAWEGQFWTVLVKTMGSGMMTLCLLCPVLTIIGLGSGVAFGKIWEDATAAIVFFVTGMLCIMLGRDGKIPRVRGMILAALYVLFFVSAFLPDGTYIHSIHGAFT